MDLFHMTCINVVSKACDVKRKSLRVVCGACNSAPMLYSLFVYCFKLLLEMQGKITCVKRRRYHEHFYVTSFT